MKVFGIAPGHFATVSVVEFVKLLIMVPSWIGLPLALILGVLAPLLTYNAPSPEQATVANAVFTAYAFRSLLFFPVILFVLCALAFAREFQGNLLRESLLRPVPRWSVILSKWTALFGWLLLSHVLTLTMAMAIALPLLGTDVDWGDVGLVVGRALLAEITYTAVAMAFAVFTRSVAATLGGLILLFFGQIGLTLAIMAGMQIDPEMMQYVTMVSEVPIWVWEYLKSFAEFVEPWQIPALGDGCFCVCGDELDPLTWQNLVSMGVLWLASLGASILVFQRTDVP